MEWIVQRVMVCDSTNTVLKRMAADGAPHGTVLIAEQQTGGRGRLGRTFHSPRGGLYMSLLWRQPVAEEERTLVTVAAAVAAAEAAEAVCGCSLGIKWVNDLYLDECKVCGILAESMTDPVTDESVIVVGFGLNVTAPVGGFSPEIADTAGALLTVDSPHVHERLAKEILSRFATYADDLPARRYLQGYRARSILDGKTVTFLRDGQTQEAQVLGVDDNGGLRVLLNGNPQTLTFGEVTLHKTKKEA